MMRLKKSQRVLFMLAGLAAVSAIGASVAVSGARASDADDADSASAALAPLSPTTARLVALSVGFTPSALAAAGCDTEDTEALLAAIAARAEDAVAIENLQQDAAATLRAHALRGGLVGERVC